MQDERPLAEWAFFGLIHPDAAPALQLDGLIDWNAGETRLPKHFLVPLAGPDGQPIGSVEFRYLTTANHQGRYAAIALHPVHAEPPPELPRLPLLSPLPPAGRGQ